MPDPHDIPLTHFSGTDCSKPMTGVFVRMGLKPNHICCLLTWSVFVYSCAPLWSSYNCILKGILVLCVFMSRDDDEHPDVPGLGDEF